MKLESLEQRVARRAVDRRALQIVKMFAKMGVRMYVYAQDILGVRHRLYPSMARTVCGATISEDAEVEFYKHATCVFCAVVR